MPRFRLIVAGCIASAALAVGLALPVSVVAAEPEVSVRAYLDGKPIPISEVSRYFCDDFSYPEIRCSTVQLLADTRVIVLALATGVDYVTIYDQTNYFGSYMHVSQDYTSLLSIGWNDKISSFKGRNSETGRFWTDWFYTGTSWTFCCNQNVASLGVHNNAFSSMYRT